MYVCWGKAACVGISVLYLCALFRLQMSPVNFYLGPLFEKALGPLIEAGALRIVYGGREVRVTSY